MKSTIVSLLALVTTTSLANAQDKDLPKGAVARMGRPFLRHAGPVAAVLFDRHGNRLYSAGSDRLRTWNVDTKLEGPSLPGVAAVLVQSPDGKMLFTGGAGRTVRGWKDGKATPAWEKSEGLSSVRALAVTPDGKTLVSGDSDGNVVLSESSTGKELGRFQAHEGWISALAFSRDGKVLISGGQDFLVKTWDFPSCKLRKTLDKHTEWVWSLAVAHHKDVFASGGWDGMIRLWDLKTGEELRAINAHNVRVYALAFSPDDKVLASGGDDSILCLWDATTGANQWRKPTGGWIYSVSFSSDGKLLAGGSEDQRVYVVASSTGQPLDHGARPILGMVFSQSNDTLTCLNTNNSIVRWKIGEEETTQTAGFNLPTTAAAMTPALYVCGTPEGTVGFRDLHTKKAMTLKGHSEQITSVAVSPIDQTALSTGRDGLALLWEGTNSRPLKGHDGWVLSSAFLSNDKVATGGADKTIRVWNTNTTREVAKLTGHTSWVRALAFAPKSGLLASASPDRTVRFWDASAGKEIHRLDGLLVLDLIFSPDGRLLASGGKDGVVRLFDTTSRKEVHKFEGQRGPILKLAFSSDGQLLASSSEDGTVIVWRAWKSSDR